MAGKGAGKFAPNSNMIWAEQATMLYRLAKEPAVTTALDFTYVVAEAVPRHSFGSGTSREEIENWVDGLDLPTESALPYDGIFPQHEPYGTGIGAMPGRGENRH